MRGHIYGHINDEADSCPILTKLYRPAGYVIIETMRGRRIPDE
jgi:hypothetical protein